MQEFLQQAILKWRIPVKFRSRKAERCAFNKLFGLPSWPSTISEIYRYTNQGNTHHVPPSSEYRLRWMSGYGLCRVGSFCTTTHWSTWYTRHAPFLSHFSSSCWKYLRESMRVTGNSLSKINFFVEEVDAFTVAIIKLTIIIAVSRSQWNNWRLIRKFIALWTGASPWLWCVIYALALAVQLNDPYLRRTHHPNRYLVGLHRVRANHDPWLGPDIPVDVYGPTHW